MRWKEDSTVVMFVCQLMNIAAVRAITVLRQLNYKMSQQQQVTLLLISADCLLCFTYLTACCASRIAKQRKLIKSVVPIMCIKLIQNAL